MLYHSTAVCYSHAAQLSKTAQASMSDSFITSPPVILMFTLSAQGFLGSFEQEKAFCYGGTAEDKEGRGLERQEAGCRFLHGERNMLGKASLCQPA